MLTLLMNASVIKRECQPLAEMVTLAEGKAAEAGGRAAGLGDLQCAD